MTEIVPTSNEFIKGSLSSFFRRCEAARNAGGIPRRDVMEGAPVPEGWTYDVMSCYYVPPNVLLIP